MVDGVERILRGVMQEAQTQKEVAEAGVQKEKLKDQLSEDRNSMGKSFANHFRRFEKQEEVVSSHLAMKNQRRGALGITEGKLRKKAGRRHQALTATQKRNLNGQMRRGPRPQQGPRGRPWPCRRACGRGRCTSLLEKTSEQRTAGNSGLTGSWGDLLSKLEKI